MLVDCEFTHTSLWHVSMSYYICDASFEISGSLDSGCFFFFLTETNDELSRLFAKSADMVVISVK